MMEMRGHQEVTNTVTLLLQDMTLTSEVALNVDIANALCMNDI